MRQINFSKKIIFSFFQLVFSHMINQNKLHTLIKPNYMHDKMTNRRDNQVPITLIKKKKYIKKNIY